MNLKENKHIYLLFLISLFAFSPILFNGFTFYSDDNYVLKNPLIKSFSVDNISLIFTSFFDGHYHPLTLLSFSFNYLISGESPFGYQLTNLLLNAINSVLVYIFILKLFKNKKNAFIIALIFALHPLHVESVARISERKDTLFSLFFLISCIYYLYFIETKNIKKYGLSILFFVLALLSKGQAVTLPLTLIIISFFILGYKSGLRQLKYIFPLFVLSGIFGFLNLKAQQYTGYFLDSTYIPIGNNIISAGYVLTHYIFRLFLPLQLSPHYPYPFNIYSAAPKIYYLYSLIFPLLFGLGYYYRKNKIVLFGVIFYFINIFLMIRFLPVSENVMPDRYNYIPLIGFSIILIYLLENLLKSKLMLGVYIVASLLFIKTFTQCFVWKNGVKVWTSAYKYYPNDSEINQNLGSHYYSNGNLEKAMQFTKRAIELDSNNILAYIDRSNYSNTQLDFKNALNDLLTIVSKDVKSSKDLSNQSTVYLQLGEFNKAIEKNVLAINKNPFDAKLYFNKASILFLQNNYKNGLKTIDKCLSLRPYFTGNAHLLKLKLALSNNDFNLALNELKESKKFMGNSVEIQNSTLAIQNCQSNEFSLRDINDPQKLNSIGLTFFKLGFYQIGINYFKKAIEIDSNYIPAYQNIVYSNYLLGDWHETYKYYKLSKDKNIIIDDKVKHQLEKLNIIKS